MGAYCLALLMMAAGFGICGTGGHDLRYATTYFWAGTIALGGVGVGILTPSFNAIISIRVSSKDGNLSQYYSICQYCRLSRCISTKET